MTFGVALKHARQARGLTAMELARRCGISRSYLSQIETGDRPAPPPDLLLQLANHVSSDPTDLLMASGRVPQSLIDWYYADIARFGILFRVPQLDAAQFKILVRFFAALDQPTPQQMEELLRTMQKTMASGKAVPR